MKKVYIAIFSIFSFLASMVTISQILSNDLKIYVLKFDCGIYESRSNNNVLSNVKKDIYEAVEFSRKNSGEIVYLEIDIMANRKHRRCDIFFPDLEQENFPNLPVWIGISSNENFGKFIELHESGYNQKWSGVDQIFMLPKLQDIPNNAIFVKKEGPLNFYAVSGPFRIGHEVGNSRSIGFFEPIENSLLLFERIECTRFRLRWPAMLRPFLPCL